MRFIIKLFQFIVFLIIQIPLIPIVIIGSIPMLYKEMKVSKKLGVSFTAGQVMQPRWIMHYFRTRDDEASVKFVKELPIESHYGFLGFMGAAIIANRICGYKPSLASIPEPSTETLTTFINSRTMHFDRIMEKNVEQAEQVVIMGAGFDLRVLKYTKGKNVKVFELDQEKTQNMKIATMKKAGIEHDWVTYIPVDFNKESWVEKLIKNGFDRTKRTFFLWESVACYLEEDVAKDTLKKMADISGKGSIITQDFYSKVLLKGETSRAMKKSADLMKKMGEPWIFGIDMSEDARGNVESLLKESGLALKNLVLFGEKNKTKKPFYAIAEAERR